MSKNQLQIKKIYIKGKLHKLFKIKFKLLHLRVVQILNK